MEEAGIPKQSSSLGLSLVLGGIASVAAIGSAQAQTVPAQPSGTVSDQFERPQLPQSQPLPPFRIERPQAGQSLAGEQFPVRDIVVSGVTTIDRAEVDALVAPLEGRSTNLAELARLADAITAVYARRGYALSFALVPEQTVENGVVRIRVVEGVIDAVAVEFKGDKMLVGRGRIESAVRRRFAPLVGAGPIRSAELERAVLEVKDLSGLDASVIVRPSTSTEGAATLVVVITTKLLDAAVGIDNRLRSEFGREEIFSMLAVNSALTVGDRIEVQGRRSLDSEAFGYASISYESQIGHSAARATGFYSRARTEARSGVLGLLDYTGTEETFRFGVRYPLMRSRASSLYLSGDLGGIDTRGRLFGINVARDNVRTLSFGVSYDWADSTGATSLASLRFVQGVEGLGATGSANPLRSRVTADPDASYVTARLFRNQPLGGGFRARFDVETQLVTSGTSLLASSECTFGGPAIGRGYDAGAISGDECWRAGVELARPIATGNNVIEPYAFLDGGAARQTGPLVGGEPRRRDAASVGIGARLFTRSGFNADLQWAFPTKDLFPGQDRKSRLFFTISFQR